VQVSTVFQGHETEEPRKSGCVGGQGQGKTRQDKASQGMASEGKEWEERGGGGAGIGPFGIGMGQQNGADGGWKMWEWGYLSGISPARCAWLRMVRVAYQRERDSIFLDQHRDGDRSG